VDVWPQRVLIAPSQFRPQLLVWKLHFIQTFSRCTWPTGPTLFSFWYV